MAVRSNRHGKIALLAMIMLLLIVVLMGMLGNSGHVATQKIETQNAADSIAFTSSLWMARGLNTVTASNHLVGESTALAVLHESLGGAELRLGMQKRTSENRQLDQVLRSLRLSSPIGRVPSPYVPPFLTSIDKKVIDFITQRTSPPGDPPLLAFATIYDARMTLKRELAVWLTAKSIANLGFLIPPPIGYVTAIAAYAVHITATVNAVLIGKEWLLLAAIEKYASAAAKVQKSVIDEQVVPTLCEFAYEVAGLQPESDGGDNADGLVVGSVLDAVEELGETLKVSATIFPNDELRLPLEFEPAPDLAGTSGGWKNGAGQPGWGDDRVIALPSANEAKDDMERKLDRALSKMEDLANKLRSARDALEKLRDEVEERSEDVEGQDQADYQSELAELDEALSDLEKQETEVRAKIEEVETQRKALDDSMQSIVSGESQNPSLANVPEQMNAQQERYSQWVRATIPNLDQLRAPILGLFSRHLKKSHAAKHYEKWTNRYALIYAWKFRSGYRLRLQGAENANWAKTETPLMMLVLDDTFADKLPQKGRQNWTDADSTSQLEAEKLFTVLGIAQREYEPLFSASMFSPPHNHGMNSFTQAIVYNANLATSPSATASRQPKFGWDTLNWIPDAGSIPEWGSEATEQPAMWPWEIFESGRFQSLVKLNWQAKLTPLTKTRLEAVQAGAGLDGNGSDAAQLAIDYADLLTH